MKPHLVDVRPNQVVQLVEHPVYDLNEQMPLLVFQGGGHEEGQDLVEEGVSTKLPSLVRDCAQSRLQDIQHQTVMQEWCGTHSQAKLALVIGKGCHTSTHTHLEP